MSAREACATAKLLRAGPSIYYLLLERYAVISENTSFVLVAVEDLAGGGAQRVALDLVRHWPWDHSTPILLLASRIGEYQDEVPPDVPVIEVGVPSSIRHTVSFLRRLKALLQGYNVTGVISHMTRMNRMMLRARMAGILKAPVVVVEHSDFLREYRVAQMPRLRYWALKAETGFLYRRAHAVVGCSSGVARQIGKLFNIEPTRVHAILNPLDQRFMRDAPMDHDIRAWFDILPRPVLVSVGRLVSSKGFDDLIRAFALLGRGSLVIVGDGPMRGELEALAQKLQVADRIAMPGFLNAPEQVLQAADLYVSASHWEGYGLTLIEAYACGLPVVAVDCDFGPAEIIYGDRPGRLVQSNDVSALRGAIEECLNKYSRFAPGTVVDLGENDPDFVAAKYQKLISIEI